MSIMTDPNTDSSHKVYDAEPNVAAQEHGATDLSAFQNDYNDRSGDGVYRPNDKTGTKDDLSEFEEDYNDSTNDSYDPASKTGPANDAVQQEQASLAASDDAPDDSINFTGGENADKPQKKRGRGIIGRMSLRSRVAVAGALTSLIVAVGLGGVFGGPLIAMFHLQNFSELLQGMSQQNNIHNRNKVAKLYRYIHLKDNGSTRLGMIQTKAQPKLIDKLTKEGYRLVPSTTTGQIRALIIDPSKAVEFKGKTTLEIKKILSERYQIPLSKIGGNAGGFINVSASDEDVRLRDFMKKNRLERILLDSSAVGRSGKKASFISMRVLRPYFNVPSAFKPWSRLDAIASQKFGSWVERNKKLSEMRERQRAKIIERQKLGKTTWATLKERVNSASGKIAGVLVFQGLICSIRDNADLVNNIQRDLIVVPGMMTAAAAMAMGDQTKTDIDVSTLAVEAAVQGMYNSDGFSVFDGKAVAVLEGRSGYAQQDATGTYEKNYQVIADAHSGNTQLNKVVNFIDNNLAGGVLCSPGAQIASGAAGLLLLATGAGGFFAKGGQVLISAGISIAVGKATLGAIEYFVNETALDITDGPLTGDNAVFGAQKLNDMVVLNSGGSVLTKEQSASLASDIAMDTRKMQREKSFVARVFNPKDPKSVAGELISHTSPNLSRNATLAMSSFLNVAKTAFSAPFNLFNNRASAADGLLMSEKLGMLPFAQQPAILAITDPYENADKAASILDTNPAPYQARAKTCYGAEITQSTDASTGKTYWDVKYVGIPDITSVEYQDAKCNQVGSSVAIKPPIVAKNNQPTQRDGLAGALQQVGSFIAQPFSQKAYAAEPETLYSLNEWGIITGLVSFGHTMEAIACGDAYIDEACQRLGMGSPPAQTTTDMPMGALGPASGKCDPRTKTLGVMDGYDAGTKFAFNGCGIVGINCEADSLKLDNTKPKCDVDGMRCIGNMSCSIESNDTTKAYPYAIVNADVSTAIQNLFEDAYNNKYGDGKQHLVATGAFRTMAKQREAFAAAGGNTKRAARPGHSNHQTGRAIDFSLGMESDVKEGASCANRATVPTSTYRWLRAHAYKYGFNQYAAEAWHFDTSKKGSRCTSP